MILRNVWEGGSTWKIQMISAVIMNKYPTQCYLPKTVVSGSVTACVLLPGSQTGS